jgi:feruloyl esterase
MTNSVARGFAVVSTDAGTRSSAMGDASWAYNNPDRVTDWGWRALHGAVVQAKQLVRQYYGQDIKYSYYSGCSTGGRQGLKEAQMFPNDFDGIIAGAPAWWTVHLQLWNMKVGLYNLPVDAPHHIPSNLFPVVQNEVLKQCDAQDGTIDNIIADPRRCRFRPEALLCKASTTNKCLTVPQLETLDKLYNDWVEANQTFIFPHLELGSEFQWNMAIGSPVPSGMGTEYVKYMLGLGPNWRWQDFDPSIIKLSEKINPGNATADNYDMEPFFQKGGKLLQYHGWADGSIAPGASLYFYEHVFRTLKPKGVDLDSSYRLFMIPGMG